MSTTGTFSEEEFSPKLMDLNFCHPWEGEKNESARPITSLQGRSPHPYRAWLWIEDMKITFLVLLSPLPATVSSLLKVLSKYWWPPLGLG
jgi:hypothetical protein